MTHTRKSQRLKDTERSCYFERVGTIMFRRRMPDLVSVPAPGLMCSDINGVYPNDQWLVRISQMLKCDGEVACNRSVFPESHSVAEGEGVSPHVRESIIRESSVLDVCSKEFTEKRFVLSTRL
jgi:hypothetical protein